MLPHSWAGGQSGCVPQRLGGSPMGGSYTALRVSPGISLPQPSRRQRSATAALCEGPPCAGAAFGPPVPRKGGLQVGGAGLRGAPGVGRGVLGSQGLRPSALPQVDVLACP